MKKLGLVLALVVNSFCMGAGYIRTPAPEEHRIICPSEPPYYVGRGESSGLNEQLFFFDPKAVQEALSKGANPNYKKQFPGGSLIRTSSGFARSYEQSPLMQAAHFGKIDIAKMSGLHKGALFIATGKSAG